MAFATLNDTSLIKSLTCLKEKLATSQSQGKFIRWAFKRSETSSIYLKLTTFKIPFQVCRRIKTAKFIAAKLINSQKLLETDKYSFEICTEGLWAHGSECDCYSYLWGSEVLSGLPHICHSRSHPATDIPATEPWRFRHPNETLHSGGNSEQVLIHK